MFFEEQMDTCLFFPLQFIVRISIVMSVDIRPESIVLWRMNWPYRTQCRCSSAECWNRIRNSIRDPMEFDVQFVKSCVINVMQGCKIDTIDTGKSSFLP